MYKWAVKNVFPVHVLYIPMNRLLAAVCAWLLPVDSAEQKLKSFHGIFGVYLGPAGTSILMVERPGLEVVLPIVILLRFLTSACQEGIFLVVMWRRACLVRWSLRMNLRSHTGHTNFFSPVWVLRWRDSSSERANLLSQPSQLQLKGFSPVCVRRWALRWELLKYVFLQPGKLQT